MVSGNGGDPEPSIGGTAQVPFDTELPGSSMEKLVAEDPFLV